MSSKVLSSTVAAETNQKLASGLDSVQQRIDRIVGTPVTTFGFADEEGQRRGFPAQYQSMETPPITEKARVYKRIRDLSGLPEEPHIAMTFGDSDVQAWKDKEKMLQQVQFDDWLTTHYDPFNNPAEANWLQSIYPEYFEARVEENKALHELQAQYTTIEIQGPKSKEDLYLLWRMENDKLLWQRVTGKAGSKPVTPESRYKRGLLNRAELIRQKKVKGDMDGLDHYKTYTMSELAMGRPGSLKPLKINDGVATRRGGGGDGGAKKKEPEATNTGDGLFD